MKQSLASIVIYLSLTLSFGVDALWWAVRGPLVLDPTAICRRTRRLAGRQRHICREELEIVQEAAKGAKVALDECQSQFSSRRWNCTTSRRSFRKILRRDTRETAFVYAITAAGVVNAVTQACTMSRLLSCSCAKTVNVNTKGKFLWGGCGDNVDYGYQKSVEFMDARPKPRRRSARPKHRRYDITTKIRLHNNEAGRIDIRENMYTQCKCHGLSGSCATKTCWKKMPLFSDSGDRLKRRFDGAVKVIGSNDGTELTTAGKSIKMFSDRDLLYSEDSPNFCERSRKMGTMGTLGRQCEPHSLKIGGCDLLCCNRGYRRMEITFTENCKCRFIWCCDVICQTCMSLKTMHYCL